MQRFIQNLLFQVTNLQYCRDFNIYIPRFTILTSITIFSLSAFSQNEGDQLFNDEVIHLIHFNDVDNSELFDIENKNVFFMVNAVIDGVETDSIGLAAKGHISWDHPHNKKPFKIKLNKYAGGKNFDGIKEFTLHNCYQDPSMIREKLAYDISRRLGLYTVRTAFAKVYIDNEYWGLYLLVEAKDELYDLVFDKRTSDAVESSDEGNLCYYGTNWDYYTDTLTNTGRYILENGSHSTAWSRFITLLNVMNNTSASQYMNVVPDYIDIDHFFAYQALNVFLMNFDSYIDDTGNQIYMFDDEADLWHVIPWDFNAAFGLWKADEFAPDSYLMIPGIMQSGCVAGKMTLVPQLRDYYLNAMCRLITDVCDTNWYITRIGEIKDEIKNAVYADQKKAFSDDDFDETTEYGYFDFPTGHIAGLKTFIKARYNLISQSLTDEGYICESGIDPHSDNTYNLFPNPADQVIFIEPGNTSTGDLLIHVSDSEGLLVKSISGGDLCIPADDLKPGLYFISVTNTKGNRTTMKMVISR